MATPFKSRNHKKHPVISDINITPFVDVLLVLLIIFMVAAPMMTSNINLDLPNGVSGADNSEDEPLVVSIKSSGEIFLQEDSVNIKNLSSKLLKLTKNNLSSKIYIRGDKNLDYGTVMDIVKEVNITGFTQVVLVTKEE